MESPIVGADAGRGDWALGQGLQARRRVPFCYGCVHFCISAFKKPFWKTFERLDAREQLDLSFARISSSMVQRLWWTTPGVLQMLHPIRPDKDRRQDRVFNPLPGEKNANPLRADLKLAGVHRAELFESTE